MQLFGFGARRALAQRLGLDIGSSSIKLVALTRRSRGVWSLAHAAVEPLAPGAIVDGQVEQFDVVAQALQRAVARSGTSLRDAVLALPAAAVIRRTVRVPGGLGDAAFESQIASEVAAFLPFPLDEVCMDFSPVAADVDADGRIGVHVAVARRDRVLDRQALAEAAGLRAVCMDVESCAAHRMLAVRDAGASDAPSQALRGLFDLGAGMARLQVLRGDETLYAGEQPLVPVDAAGTADAVTGLAQDLAQALQVFLHSTAHQPLDRVFLSGGAATLPGLADAVAAQAGLPCDVLRPFQGMSIGKAVAQGGVDPVRDAPALVVACGLAWRGVAP